MQYTFYFGMKHILYKSKEVYVAQKKEVYGLRKVVYTYRMAICTIFCVLDPGSMFPASYYRLVEVDRRGTQDITARCMNL